MSLDLAGIDHNCNVVRRQMEDEFRNLSPIFLVHKSGERERTLLEKRNMILAKPFGRKIYDYLTMTKETDQDSSLFLGTIINQGKLMGLRMKRQYSAIFFINADDFYHDENAKHYLYHLAWHALHAVEEINAKYAKTDFPQTDLIKPPSGRLERAKNNLMADIFGAVMMETQGHKDYIKHLAKKRSAEALKATPHLFPEIHPYPIAYEASKLVYGDLKFNIDNKSKLIKQVMDLSSEVSLTYGDDSIQQWLDFARPAQEMAWQGYSEDKILGHAIYTSKETFVRALAYQIAELVDIEPDSASDLNSYNPYNTYEHNARVHKVSCDETGQRLANIAVLQGNAEMLYLEAERQNEKLLEGKGCGWCAHALSGTAKRFEQMMTTQDTISADHVFEIFQTALSKTSWDDLRKLSTYLHQLHRKDNEINYNTLAALSAKMKLPEHLQDYFRLCANKAPKQAAHDKDHITDMEPRKGGVEQYMKDPNLVKREIKALDKDAPNASSYSSDE